MKPQELSKSEEIVQIVLYRCLSQAPLPFASEIHDRPKGFCAISNMMRLSKITNISNCISSRIKGRHTFVENNAKPWHSLKGSRAVGIVENGFLGRKHNIVFRNFPGLKTFSLPVIKQGSKVR